MRSHPTNRPHAAARLAVAVVHADGQVHDGESAVLLAMVEQWRIDLSALATPAIH